MNPGGPNNMNPGGPNNMNPGGPNNMGPGGPNNMGPGGPNNMGPGGPNNMSPGGPNNMGPGPGIPNNMGPGSTSNISMRNVGQSNTNNMMPTRLPSLNGPPHVNLPTNLTSGPPPGFNSKFCLNWTFSQVLGIWNEYPRFLLESRKHN